MGRWTILGMDKDKWTNFMVYTGYGCIIVSVANFIIALLVAGLQVVTPIYLILPSITLIVLIASIVVIIKDKFSDSTENWLLRIYLILLLVSAVQIFFSVFTVDQYLVGLYHGFAIVAVIVTVLTCVIEVITEVILE